MNSETVTDFLVFRRENPNSILSCVTAARENARMIRDQITQEMWECINALYLLVREQTAKEIWKGEVYAFFEEIKSHSHRFQGLTDATYFRDEGYIFLQLGRFVERVDQTSRIIDIKYFMVLPANQEVGGSVDLAGWVAVLRSCSALDAFHRQVGGEIVALKVTDFLVLSRSFPRSLRFCLRQIDENLRALTNTGPGLFSNDAEKLAGRLRSEVIYTTASEIFSEGLHEFLDRIQMRIIEIHNAIVGQYLALPQIDMEEEIALQKSAGGALSQSQRQA